MKMSSVSVKNNSNLLLVSNYSNHTGYAWNNIYRLFEQIALHCSKHGVSTWVSFAHIEQPLEWNKTNIFTGVFELPPIPKKLRDLQIWLWTIHRYKIRYIYVTDQDNWSLRYALFRLVGVRRIIVHNRVSVENPLPAIPDGGVRGVLKWILCRIPFIQATRIYAVSNFVRNRLIFKAKVKPERVVTILNGINIDHFSPKKVKEPTESLQIFCAGRATVYKGIGVLIEATALLRDKFNLFDFKVRYAGNGPDLQTFINLSKNLQLGDKFIFLGKLSNIESDIINSDIVVFPSIWGDACPSFVSEALAAGKPLVATRVGGVPELIGEESTAIMVEPGNSMELAEALARLIQYPEERNLLGIRGRLRAEKSLDHQRYYNDVLKQLNYDLDIDKNNLHSTEMKTSNHVSKKRTKDR